MPDRSGEPRPGRDEPTTDQDQYTTPSRAELRAIATRACHLCDDHGYRPNHVIPCDHIDRTDTAQRGIALVRAALNTKKHPNPTPTATTTPPHRLHPQT